MNSFNSQELQTFVIEAELIHEKVKALAENRLSPEQFDKLQLLRSQDARRRKQAKQRRENQLFEAKVRGTQGKGIGNNFLNFCKICRLQYELPTPMCLKCDRKTLTLEERKKELQLMVQQYKTKKLNREERKHKWEMWKKTQSMLWKKTNTHYTKWENFVSDSEEEPQQDPILPKNDPNFKALQMDFQERRKRRETDTEKAKKLKEKGNNQMKQGNYQKAMQFYTLALQHIKDIKSIYTNRALAFIKLKRFKKAIKDCDNVIQYMEVFQKIGENKDLTFKAYTRRAKAKKEIKQYQQALKDVEYGLKLIPNDKDALLLKKQLEGFIVQKQHIQKLMRSQVKQNMEGFSNSKKEIEKKIQMVEQNDGQMIKQVNEQKNQEDDIRQDQEQKIIKQIAEAQLKQQEVQRANKMKEQQIQAQRQIETAKNIQKLIEENPIQQIKNRAQSLKEFQIEALINVIRSKPQYRAIFIQAKGLTNALNKLMNVQSNSKLSLLICHALKADGVAEKQIWEFGIQNIYNKIIQLLTDSSKTNQAVYERVEGLTQILTDFSLCEIYRQLIANLEETYVFVEKAYSLLITKDKKQTELLNSFLNYLSNICVGDMSGIKNKFINQQKFMTIVNSLFLRILKTHTKNRQYLNLKKGVYNLLSNLLTNLNHRQALVTVLNKDKNQDSLIYFLTNQLKTYLLLNDNFMEYIQSLLSVLVNASLGTKLESDEIADVIFQRFISNRQRYSRDILHRSLLIISRLKYTNIKISEKWLNKFNQFLIDFEKKNRPKQEIQMVVSIIRILNRIYENDKQGKFLGITKQPPKQLVIFLFGLLNENPDNEALYCNTTNLICLWVDLKNQQIWKKNILGIVKGKIKSLVFVAKERTGNFRKNAAILLAKCAQDSQCREQLDKHHGMDVLKSIAHLINKK